VRDQDGNVIAQGTGLERGQPGPMSYLVRQEDTILLEDGRPTLDDLGRLVILPAPQELMACRRAQRMALADRVPQPHLSHKATCPATTPSPSTCPHDVITKVQ
jgi:hypothetical protein